MESPEHKKRIFLSFVCYAVILIGLLSAINLYQRIEDEQRDRQRYLNINGETLYLGINDICRAKSQMDMFFFDDDRRYKLYTGDYGSEVVFTNCYDLYSLYIQANTIYQYFTFDMGLKDPDNASLYQQAAQPLEQLKTVIIENPSEEEFRSHSDDIIEAIERIEPLRKIWEEEYGGWGSSVSIELMRTICECFVNELNGESEPRNR